MYVAETGYHLPEERVTNADLVARVDTSEDWILGHVGITERRRAPSDEDTSDLGVRATKAALARAGWSGDELDLLVCATSTPDRLIPSTATIIGKKMGIDPVSFDVNAACSGFVYGLSTACALASFHGYERAAVTVAEKYTRITDYDDRATCIFFGDGAATVLLQKEEPEVGFEVLDTSLKNLNEGADCVTTPLAGYFHQDGRTVKRYAVNSLHESAEQMLGRHGLLISDIRYFTGHQANLTLLEEVGKLIGLSPEQHWFNVDLCGNQGGAGVGTTFCSKAEAHADELEDGDLFLLTVFGAGFTMGSALLRRVDTRTR